jgi:predicted 3-demethylubiquinone-9 3-methyltransferase (glyoxalase superfamily)
MIGSQKIKPFLWFNGQAEEAATYYTSVFKDSKILKTTYYSDAGPGPKGSVLTVEFEIDGLHLVALNGGPQYKFTEAVSFAVMCDSQKEVDELWAKLTAGGEPGQCGWLKDKFGLSWQVVPKQLPKMLTDPDPVKSQRVMEVMMDMSKLEIAELEAAYNGT